MLFAGGGRAHALWDWVHVDLCDGAQWHCGAFSMAHLPIHRGFSRHFGFLGGGEDHMSQQSYEMNMSVDLWRDTQPAWGENGTYSCHLYGKEAVDIVDDHMLSDRNRSDDGLFMYHLRDISIVIGNLD
jgi:hypothetical protein